MAAAQNAEALLVVPHTFPLPGSLWPGPVAAAPCKMQLPLSLPAPALAPFLLMEVSPSSSSSSASLLWKTHFAHALVLPHAAQHSLQLPTLFTPTFACCQPQSLVGSGHIFVGASGGGAGGDGGGAGPGGSPAQWIFPLLPSSRGSHVTVVPLRKPRA